MTLRSALAIATAFVALSFSAAAQQQKPPFEVLSPPQPIEANGKIEVIEFFWYGSPHCSALEPSVNAWVKNPPKDVTFKRIPAVPSEQWGVLAYMYYTLEAMGLLEQYHAKVFDAI